MDLESVKDALLRRGFAAETFADRKSAAARVMEIAKEARSVGWGGSETVKEMGLREAMADAGKEIRDHETSTGAATAWRRRYTARSRWCSSLGATR